MPSPVPSENIVAGMQFGKWTVIRVVRAGRGKGRSLCRCTCGTEREVLHNNLARIDGKASSSCGGPGCRRPSVLTHGETRGRTTSVEYNTWRAMRARCTDAAALHYARYGGRGITVCARWDSFEAFLSDMGRKPSPKHTLDRIDNDGNYEPSNCRWATGSEQRRNSSTIKLSLERAAEIRARVAAGETKAEVARRFGISATMVRYVVTGHSWSAA